MLTAGAGWTGEAGSGYAGFPPAAVTRTGPMATCAFLTVPWQHFDADLIVPVSAGAFWDGDHTDGIASVEIFCEGNSVTLSQRTAATYIKPDGSEGVWYAYAARLDHADMLGRFAYGAVDIYARAIPKDATIQSRVIGPFRCYARPAGIGPGLRFETEYTVGPSGSFSTLTAALTAARALPEDAPAVITILNSGSYVLDSTGGSLKVRRAWTRIRAAPGVTADILSPNNPTLSTRSNFDGVEFFGPGIQMDVNRFRYEAGDGGVMLWRFNGARSYSPEGPHVFGPTRDGARSWTFCFIENALIENQMNGALGARLLSNTTIRNISLEASKSGVVTHNVLVDGISYGDLRDNRPAMTIAYAGVGAATIEMTGRVNSASRTFTLRVGGATVAEQTITTGGTWNRIDYYSFADLVGWINAVPGWSAVALAPDERAVWLNPPGATAVLTTFPVTQVTAAPITLPWVTDQHADGWQLFGSTTTGQVIIEFVTTINIDAGQMIFIEGSFSGPNASDVFIYCFENSGSSQPSQVSAPVNPAGRTHLTIKNLTHYATFVVRKDGGFEWPAAGKSGILNSVLNRFSEFPVGNYAGWQAHRVTLFATASSQTGEIGELQSGSSAADMLPAPHGAPFLPVAAGAAMSPDGSYRGARLPSGAWNY